MSKSFLKLLISQLFANLADIFLRVSLIANIYVITKSVIATSMVPILIGLSAFVASLLVPLVIKKISLNRVLSFTQCGKTFLLAILLVMLIKAQFVPALGLYIFVVAISILWLASRLTNYVSRIISIRLISCRNILMMLFMKCSMGPWLSPLLTRKRKISFPFSHVVILCIV